jgi:hypothetical protein
MILSPARFEAEYDVDQDGEDTLSFPAEQVAIHYIDEQLTKARRSLRRTRIFCLITLFVVLGYMSFLTIALRSRLLRPDAAAEMAAYYFSKFAVQNGLTPSASVGEEPRKSIALASGSPMTKSVGNPDRPFTELNTSANADPLKMQAQVAAYVHGFISQPHENLQDIVREAQHPKTVQQLSDELDQEIRERLPSQDRYGWPDSDYMSYMNQKLATLSELESQFNRLAHADDLTPYEKALRHIIASTMGSSREGS